VNLTNSDDDERADRELIAIGETTRTDNLPSGAKPEKVHFLVAEKSPEFTQKGTWIEVRRFLDPCSRSDRGRNFA